MAFGVGLPQPGCDFQKYRLGSNTQRPGVDKCGQKLQGANSGIMVSLQAARFRTLSILGKSALFPSPGSRRRFRTPSLLTTLA